jgi:hypothetical protein
VAPQGRRKLQEELLVFADEDGIEALSPRIRLLIEDLRKRNGVCSMSALRPLMRSSSAWRGKDEAVRRLTTIRGIGMINAMARGSW